jgi:hypothetical protein
VLLESLRVSSERHTHAKLRPELGDFTEHRAHFLTEGQTRGHALLESHPRRNSGPVVV